MGVEVVILFTSRPVDAIAINAGGGVWGDFSRETDLKEELDLIYLDITSAVHLAKCVVKNMVERGAGRLLFIA